MSGAHASVQAVVVRPATPADAARVEALLVASYSSLLRTSHEPSLLAQALPYMVRPQASLLGSGTWYLAEDGGGAGPPLGCGGWTVAAPGGGAATPHLAHLRHFATRPDMTRRGVGSRILARCVADATAHGIEVFECLATLAAEPFYARLGFDRVEAASVMLGNAVDFPVVRMRLRLGAFGAG
ncbi:GNAT family N-acetyltransferase [Falsiroseomonas sp. HW251]|uniref:GNAT family N-acetyltransferase n=1 Tax=Falsiroseomonas sp. HW251 TaxID=3390998 RepID=UPI003D31942F